MAGIVRGDKAGEALTLETTGLTKVVQQVLSARACNTWTT